MRPIKFCKQIAASFKSYADEHQIDFKTIFPKEPVSIYFDRDKLEKIITNLVSNAIKFTSEGGEVILSVAIKQAKDDQSPFDHTNDYVEIKVEDNGIGIAEDQVEFIFNRFHQAGNPHQSEQEGVGIGLSLARELVELHKGQISVHSQKEVGSTFKVFLQIGKDHLKEDQITTDDNLPVSDQSGINDLMADPIEDILLKDERGNTNSQYIILIVDDDADLRSYIRERLTKNYSIIEASNGKEGFDKSIEVIPDLIISDVVMPELDGIKMCHKLKTDQRTSHIPIILLTARADAENVIIGLETGADDYETKPFDSRILEVKVKNLIRSREVLRERFTDHKKLVLEPKEITITSTDETFLKNCLESIENNMSNSEYGVEDLGENVGISRMQLYRKLKALTDLSPNEFIRAIRLKRAAQLLEQKEMTVAEVTYAVGFNHLQYFRGCFKKQFGVSPSAYVKSKEPLS